MAKKSLRGRRRDFSNKRGAGWLSRTPSGGKRVTMPRGGGYSRIENDELRGLQAAGRRRAGRSDAAGVIGCESGAAVLAARSGSIALPITRRGDGRFCWPRLVSQCCQHDGWGGRA